MKIDETGNPYGKLIVLEMLPSRGKRALCRCGCSCGNTIDVIAKNLRNGNTKSCGCLKGDKIRSRLENLIGQKMNRLLVLDFHEIRNNKRFWKCLCNCGNITFVSSRNFSKGCVQSCGCLGLEKRTEGHKKINLFICEGCSYTFYAQSYGKKKCFFCRKLALKIKYRKFNKTEKAKAIRQRWKDSHPEYYPEYYIKNINRHKETGKIWYENNPGKYTEYNAKRRALLINAEGSFSLEEWKDLCTDFHNKCFDCKRKDRTLTIGHIIPLCKEGTNWIWNILPQCQSCNSRQGKKIHKFLLFMLCLCNPHSPCEFDNFVLTELLFSRLS